MLLYVDILALFQVSMQSFPFTKGSDREGSGGDTTRTPASSKSSLCAQLNLPAVQRAAAPF